MAELPDFAPALGRLSSGLYICTVGSGDSAMGFLASWVQQVGFQPPALTVAVQRDRNAVQQVRDNGCFALSVLADNNRALLKHFAGGADSFAGLDIAATSVGAPYLKDALAHLACRVIGEVCWTDHVLFCAEVVGGACSDGAPMVHVRKNGLNY